MNIIITDKPKGYKMISSTHMWDKRLSWKAKAILTMMLMLPPNWDLRQDNLADLSSDGEAAVRSAIKELIQYRYLSRERTRTPDGKIGAVLYKICQCPDNTDCIPAKDDVESVENNFNNDVPESTNPSVENQTVDDSRDARSTHKLIYNNKYNLSYYNQNKDRLIDNARARESECVSQCGKVENSEIQHLYYHRVIANNIGYDALQSEFRDSREELDELVELMVDVLTADPDSTTYIAGQEMRTSVVQSRFLKLQQVHLEQVLLSLSKTTKQVTNMRSYLLTCLYQSFVTAHNEIRQEVNAANFA